MGEIFKLFGTIGLNNDEANKGIDETTGRAKSASGKIAGFFKKAATVIATVFAAQKLVDFGRMTVEAAASAQAIQTQFEQVFGDSQGAASKAINGMAKEFGMLPNRIKPSFTSTTSMFKGLGLSTEEAMEQATKAVTMASDAAAFYDMSYENANGALNSFIKGNYEGGESIGLFANETQMAAWAAEELGVDWKTLDEAGKQIARLEFAQAMQEAAGATGQAARESESYENQLGNMKQAWQDFAAIVGAPILGIAVQGLQTVTGWLQTAGEKVQDFQAWLGDLKQEVAESTAWQTLQEVIGMAIDKLKEMFEAASQSETLDNLKDLLVQLKDAILDINFVEVVQSISDFMNRWAPLIAGIAAGLVTFKALTTAITIVGGAFTALKSIQHAITGFKLAITVFGGVKNAAIVLIPILTGISWPILAIVAAVTAAVAAGVLLWKNWDKIKAKASELGAKISETWDGIKQWTSETWSNITGTVKSKASEIASNIKSKWNEADQATAVKFSDMARNISDRMTESDNAVVQKAGSILSSITDNFDAAYGETGNIFSAIAMTIGLSLQDAFQWAAEKVSQIKTTITETWSSITNWLTGVWQGIVEKAQAIWQGLVNVFTFIWLLIKEVFNVAWLAISTPLILAWQAIVIAALAIWQPLAAFFSMLWEGIKNVFTTVWNSITSFLNSAWLAIVTVARQVFEPLRAFFSQVWNSIKSIVTTVVSTIVSYALTWFNNLKTNVIAIFNAVSSFVTSVWNAIKSVITSVVSAVVSFVVDRFNALRNNVITIFNAVKSVASTVWNAIKNVIQTVVTAVVTFVKNRFTTLKNNVMTIFNAVKSIATTVWNAIKNAIQTAVNAIRNVVTNVFNSVKSTVSSIFNSIKTTASNVWNSIKSSVTRAVNSIKSGVTSSFNSVKSTVSRVWNSIKSSITNAINAARDAVSRAINKIKGFMNFEWSLPKLKLPRISISGKFSLSPPSVPKFGIDWFAKGGILTKAMAFGMNGNDIMVGGEAGKEAVLPLNRETLGGIGAGIASSMGWSDERIAEKLDAIIELLIEFFTGYDPDTQVVMDTGALVGAIKHEINRQLGNDVNLRGRGR